jgi:hypothetical protein
MEKSFINFHKNHPNWRPTDAAGRAVIENLEQFKADK